ncbi:putative C2H2-type domain-containing protein [Seiridium cardinale]|uniref:C2H2-type domain-containing protein n=1 Tax=Seiridium cardinale TaxID=138064 RepID=A0ABR2Y8S6_9PEZI
MYHPQRHIHSPSYGTKCSSPVPDGVDPLQIEMHSQRPEHDADQCHLRRDAVDDCSKARFMLMLMDYYFLDEIDRSRDPCLCPMLRCRIPFTSAVAMVQHVKRCNGFGGGEAWCPKCDVPGRFPLSNRSHCVWKRDTLTQKVMKPIDSIVGHVSRRLSGRRSPAPGHRAPSSSSPSNPEPLKYTDYSHTNVQAASNSTEIDSRSRSELANDPVKTNPVEMGVPSSTSGTIFPSYSIPAQAEYKSSREPAGSAELNGSTSIELPAQSRDADHETTLSTTSFSFSTGSSSTMSSTPTNPKRTSIVSPLSTVSEYDSYAAQKERRASPGAVYTEGLTASPITEELPADLWSSAPSLSNSGTYSSSSNSFRPGLLDDFNIDIATMMADEPQFYNAEMHDSQWIAEICPVHPVPEMPGTVAPFQLLRDRAVHRQLAPRQESGDSGVTLVDLNDDEIELGQRTEGTFNEATDNSSASSRPPPLAHAVINGEESLQCPYLGCIKTIARLEGRREGLREGPDAVSARCVPKNAFGV